ncbi:MAG TPA: hypothetical protein DDY16_07655, partial [Tenacibaculum sp.]|nr:hypothetical protein [Tenacibaculum sp.]
AIYTKSIHKKFRADSSRLLPIAGSLLSVLSNRLFNPPLLVFQLTILNAVFKVLYGNQLLSCKKFRLKCVEEPKLLNFL